MYVSRIKLKNFGKLAEGEYYLTNGMNIIRGENSVGKSTMIEAILYGLFGTTALRGTLEDSTTQGEDVNDLRVEVDFGPYTILRSKSSASISGGGARISGQGNVSNYFYDLLGVQKGLEGKILVAGQGDMTGVLEGRAGEVNSLIEELAGFNQIDELVERVKEKFPSGNKATLEELILTAESKLGEKNSAVLEDTSLLIEENAGLQAEMLDLDSSYSTLSSSISRNKDDLAEILAASRLKESLQNQATTINEQLVAERLRLGSAEEKSKLPLIDTTEAGAYQEKYQTLQQDYNFYKEFCNVNPWSGDLWDDSYEELLAEMSGIQAELKLTTKDITEHKLNIKNQKALINSEDSCKACGQDIKHLHIEINERAQREVDRLTEELTHLEEFLVNESKTLTILQSILTEQDKRERFSAHADTSAMPWSLEWFGEVPEEPSAIKLRACADVIRTAAVRSAEIKQAEEAVVSSKLSITSLEGRLEKVEDELNSIFPQPSEELIEVIKAQEAALVELRSSYKGCQDLLEANNSRIKQLEYEQSAMQKAKDELSEEIADLNKRLEVDSYNQTILAAVRKARPEVVNRLWGNVLGLTSSIFGSVVGEESIVEKSEKGFVVDGLPVHRLSGSTKAVLGISLRVALRDIFSPSAGFMIFDEPSAFCDANRQAAVTSALAAIQGQVIVITHESISDSVADNIIEIL